MIMAYWNGMKWEVSNKQIAYLESFTTSCSIETKTNADKEGKKPTESVGINLVEMSFNTTYRIETGTKDIRAMINKWNSLLGKTAPLIIGKSMFGPEKMQLQSVNVSNVEINSKGVIRAATCSFKLKEYSEEEKGAKSKSKRKSSSNTKGVTPKKTAVIIGARHSDKANKKTVSI